MEIIVDAAGYPTEMIAKNSHDYRPLGLGYANLGALLMAFGLPYDSDAGRDFAATLTVHPLRRRLLAVLAHRRSLPRPRSSHAAHPAGAHRRRSLPRLLRQPRALPRRHPHAPRRGQQHRPLATIRPSPSSPRSSTSSSTPAATPGTAPSPTANSTATATPRSPSSPPPAPSAS